MQRVVDIAQAIADELKEQGQPALFSFTPAIELKDLKYRIMVIPADEQIEVATRTSNMVTSTVTIGVQRKTSKLDEEVKQLIELVRNIGRKYLRRRICESLCGKVHNMPLYDAGELTDTGVFTGVVQLDFEGYEVA